MSHSRCPLVRSRLPLTLSAALHRFVEGMSLAGLIQITRIGDALVTSRVLRADAV